MYVYFYQAIMIPTRQKQWTRNRKKMKTELVLHKKTNHFEHFLYNWHSITLTIKGPEIIFRVMIESWSFSNFLTQKGF